MWDEKQGFYRKHAAICPHCRKVVEALPLTYQQWKVAEGLINGESTQEIANRLFICIKTVEAHRKKILETLGVRSVAHLIRWAHDKGLLELVWKEPMAEGNNE